MRKKNKGNVKFAIGLVILSVIIYVIHYHIFNDLHHIFIYMIEDIAFIPIEVLVVSLILHKILDDIEKKKMIEKINMVVGVFFTEVGSKMLKILYYSDKNINDVKDELLFKSDWNNKQYQKMLGTLREHKHNITADYKRLEEIKVLLVGKRDFLLKLIENPMIFEHDDFTELLMAVFHLEEELHARKNVEDIVDEDLKHIIIDAERVYRRITEEYTKYIIYLKDQYPYLHSFYVRTNPFDLNAKVEVTKK